METRMDISRRACETMFRKEWGVSEKIELVSEKIQLVSEKIPDIQEGNYYIYFIK